MTTSDAKSAEGMIPMPEPPEVATIRHLLDGLLELARDLPQGLDTPLEFGICDSEDLQLIGKVDVDQWSRVSVTGDGPPTETFVLLRGHVHPGEKAGRLLRGAASDADQELRDLTGEG